MSDSLNQVYELFTAEGAWGKPMSRECQCRGGHLHPEGHWQPNASQPFQMVINEKRHIAGLNREDDGSIKLYYFETGDATWRAVREVDVIELGAIGRQIKDSTWQRPVNTEG